MNLQHLFQLLIALPLRVENQIWQPKFIDEKWIILRLDKKLHADFNHKLKLKLALELGDEFLKEKFYAIQSKNIT